MAYVKQANEFLSNAKKRKAQCGNRVRNPVCVMRDRGDCNVVRGGFGGVCGQSRAWYALMSKKEKEIQRKVAEALAMIVTAQGSDDYSKAEASNLERLAK